MFGNAPLAESHRQAVKMGITIVAVFLLALPSRSNLHAAELIVELENIKDVTFVAAINRWDEEGQPVRPINPKAKIDAPAVSHKAVSVGKGRWEFSNLPPGRYDLVVLTKNRIRVEGFHYPPILDFDSPIAPDEKAPPKAQAWITRHISQMRLYENKVTPLFLGGDDQQVRVLVQLLRDKPTSFDAQFGEQVATIRHEVWQYSYRFGGWAKEKRSQVLDRILMPKSELRKWTWIWAPELGTVQVKDKPIRIRYRLPDRLSADSVRGLLPY